MSDQEMQFADPDWEPTQTYKNPVAAPQSAGYKPQPVNEDRLERSQRPIVETPSEQVDGYTGLPPYRGEAAREEAPQRTQYRRVPGRRRRPWLWIIIAILLISLVSGGWSSLGFIGQKSVTDEHLFSTSGAPTIIIHETDGNIHVHRGNSLDIETVKQSSFFQDPNNIKVQFNQTANTITVNVDEGSSFLSSNSVDFNITLPQNANLDLATTSGDISVNDTSGQMTLATNSGNISAAGDTLSANSFLRTTSGDIDSRNDTFSGDAGLQTVSGDVSMNQDTLNGPAKVNTTSGNIDFNGSITAPVDYQFNSVSGDISIGVPSTSNFNFQATTTSGSIHSDDFPSISNLGNDQGPGNQASGNVGTSPFASIHAGTTSGDITIHQNS